MIAFIQPFQIVPPENDVALNKLHFIKDKVLSYDDGTVSNEQNFHGKVQKIVFVIKKRPRKGYKDDYGYQ